MRKGITAFFRNQFRNQHKNSLLLVGVVSGPGSVLPKTGFHLYAKFLSGLFASFPTARNLALPHAVGSLGYPEERVFSKSFTREIFSHFTPAPFMFFKYANPTSSNRNRFQSKNPFGVEERLVPSADCHSHNPF